MGNRLSKIYTRTGDDGSTGLADGTRVSKTDARIQAMGDVDELNCVVGLLIAKLDNPSLIQFLSTIQHTLFDLGAELSIPNSIRMKPHSVSRVEQALDDLNQDLAPLREFILPGGSEGVATCHLARAVCRRAERQLLQADAHICINPESIKYINRLSDYLFVLARSIARLEGTAEVFWCVDNDPEAPESDPNTP